MVVRVIFIDVVLKSVYIYCGWIVDLFLDILECGVYIISVDILWFVMFVLIWFKYKYKMVSRVVVSIVVVVG